MSLKLDTKQNQMRQLFPSVTIRAIMMKQRGSESHAIARNYKIKFQIHKAKNIFDESLRREERVASLRKLLY